MRKRFSIVAATAGIALLVTSCSGSSDSEGTESAPNLAFAETTTGSTNAPRDFGFDEPTQLLVEFEAEWACDVQHRTFDSTNEISRALEDRLAELGVNDDTYGEFRERLATEEVVREAILDHYAATCLG